MQLRDIPFIGPLLEAGAEDSVFDALLLLGPIAILLITMMGRTWLSVLIAVGYTGTFLGYILYKGIRSPRE